MPLALPVPVLLCAAWHGHWVPERWARGAGWAVGNSADPSRNGRRAGAGEGLSCRRLSFPNSASASDPRRPPGSACACVRGRWGLLAQLRGLGTVLSHRHSNPTGTRPTGESRCRSPHQGKPWAGTGWDVLRTHRHLGTGRLSNRDRSFHNPWVIGFVDLGLAAWIHARGFYRSPCAAGEGTGAWGTASAAGARKGQGACGPLSSFGFAHPLPRSGLKGRKEGEPRVFSVRMNR